MTATRSAFVIACLSARPPTITRGTSTLRAGPRRCQSGDGAAHEVEKYLAAERLLEHGHVGRFQERPGRAVGGVARDEHEAGRQRRILGDDGSIEFLAAAVGHADIGNHETIALPASALRTTATPRGQISPPIDLQHQGPTRHGHPALLLTLRPPSTYTTA